MAKKQNSARVGLEFRQGLQLFFVRKILDERYTMASEAGSNRGIDFFVQWSNIVCQGTKKDKKFPLTIKVPPGFDKPWQIKTESSAFQEVGGKRIPLRVEEGERIAALSFVPDQYRDAYRPLLENAKFAGLFYLMSDDNLGRLMQIPYPAEVAEISVVIGTTKDAGIAREAMARQLKRKPDEVIEDDYKNITALDFSGSEISNLDPLTGLTDLQRVYLSRTQVSDIEPLKGLTNLQELSLSGTQVSDIEPLKGLTKLQELSLSGTQVKDIEPLKGLTNLQELSLSGTQVSDIEPLKGLTNLQMLDLSGTQVKDIEAQKRTYKPANALAYPHAGKRHRTAKRTYKPARALPFRHAGKRHRGAKRTYKPAVA